MYSCTSIHRSCTVHHTPLILENSRIRGEQQFGIRFSVTENIPLFHAYARKNTMGILNLFPSEFSRRGVSHALADCMADFGDPGTVAVPHAARISLIRLSSHSVNRGGGRSTWNRENTDIVSGPSQSTENILIFHAYAR